MRETILTPSECVVVETFKGHLGNYILIVFYDQFLSLQYLFYNFITSLVSLIKTVIVINTTLVQSSDIKFGDKMSQRKINSFQLVSHYTNSP